MAYKNHKIIAVVPCRGGSKSIPRKNIKLMAGKPLLYYMLTAAMRSKYIDVIAFSSEDKEILSVANRYGKKSKKFILIKRPKNLALDTTPSLPVVQHAVQEAERELKIKFDPIVLLQVTCPFVSGSDIDNCVKKAVDTKADTVVSVYKVPGAYHPVKMKRIINDRLYQYVSSLPEKTFRRQDFDPVYKRNGGVFISTRKVVFGGGVNSGFFSGKITRPYIMPAEKSLDIDEELDFQIAGEMIKNLKKEGKL